MEKYCINWWHRLQFVTPNSISGLFKMEWEGDGFVGLAAKTYYCFHNESPDKDKHSAKGINRNFRLSKRRLFEGTQQRPETRITSKQRIHC